MSSPNATYHHPYVGITATNRGGQIFVVDLVGLVIALFSIVVRLYLGKRELEKGLGFVVYKDDLLCYGSTVLNIIVFALVWAGVRKGNGTETDLLSDSSLVQIQKIQYATDLFYILAMYTTRVCIILLYQRLQSTHKNRLWMLCIAGLTAWAIACFFISALKCDLSHPWIEYNSQCSGLLARWDFIEISGIVVEAILFCLGAYLAYIVQMETSSKLKILFLFSTRALVVVFAALRIAYLPDYFHSTNPTYTGAPALIYALAEMYASLVTTTTPLLKSFMIKFKFLGAKPTVVLLRPPYNSLANTDGVSKTNRSAETATPTPAGPRTRNRFMPGGRKAGKHDQVTTNTFSEYEQWMPEAKPTSGSRERHRKLRGGGGGASSRGDSSPTDQPAGNCGDTDMTSKTDEEKKDDAIEEA